MSAGFHCFLIGRKQQQAEEKSRVPIGTREALDFFGAAAIFAFEERMTGIPIVRSSLNYYIL
jgi:hypothetical protein